VPELALVLFIAVNFNFRNSLILVLWELLETFIAKAKVTLLIIIYSFITNGRTNSANITYIGEIGNSKVVHFVTQRTFPFNAWGYSALHTKKGAITLSAYRPT
jgi:hypothetical protein